MDWKEINPLWNLSDTFTVNQAAALIAGFDPNAVDASGEFFRNIETNLTDSDGILYVLTALNAITNAINAGTLKAMIRRDARLQGWDEFPNYGEGIRELYKSDQGEIHEGFEPAVIYREAPDWGKTTIDRQDLIDWLTKRRFRAAFFFPDAVSDAPDYLNPNLPNGYSPKLAAAVNAWLAVRAMPDTKGKSVKEALKKWLRENAATYGLTNDDGKVNETGIEEVAKVANWQPSGGAPKTPSK